MKTTFNKYWLRAGAAGLALAASVAASQAQTSFPFNTSITGWAYGYGPAAGTTTFATNDAANSPASGSLDLNITYTTANFQHASQFNFPSPQDFSAPGATLSFDVKVDPASGLDQFGSASFFQVDFSVTSAYSFRGEFGGNVGIVTTNNGWAHYSVPLTGANLNDVRQITIDPYDGNYTNTQTAIMYVDNITITLPAPTYPDFTAFTFDNTNFLGGFLTNWYGTGVTVSWDPLKDSSNNAHSGAVYIQGQLLTGDNRLVSVLAFDTNWAANSFPATETNVIDGTHYASVDFDVLWDATNSTVSIGDFNTNGDIFGFPLGLYLGPGAPNNLSECLGSSGQPGVVLATAASNGWVHISMPINHASQGITSVEGLAIKKYVGNVGVNGNVAFWMDNIVFKGGALAPVRPSLSISKPVPGLDILNNSGSPYDRESLETFGVGYAFADQANPVTYSINIGQFPNPAIYPNYDARIYIVPNINAVEAEADYTEACLLMIDISENSSGTATTTIRCKTNNPAANGDLYDAGLPSFTASNVLGNWSYKFTQNTNILVTAPDGTSTNLPFPLGLTSAQVSSFFGASASQGGTPVYYGGYNNGGGNVGQRVIINSVGFSEAGNSATFTDNFTTDTSININNGVGTTGIWSYASDSTTATSAIFLTSPTWKYYVDWTTPASGFLLETNKSLQNAAGWSTNNQPAAVQLGDHFDTVIDATNLPPSGNLFFRLEN